ncbi:hypothetical protein C8R42DRAFT_652366 [Lentinula raphanica]|nr:hypothetical protein C8R42DRAFT_652366 [Lentinula raphanica]
MSLFSAFFHRSAAFQLCPVSTGPSTWTEAFLSGCWLLLAATTQPALILHSALRAFIPFALTIIRSSSSVI